MQRMLPFVVGLGRLGVAIAGICCVAMFLFTASGIVLRPVRLQINWSEDIGGLLMAWLIFFALAETSFSDIHLRVTFLVDLLPTTLRAVLVLIGHYLFIVYAGGLVYVASFLFFESWRGWTLSADVMEIPLAYPQAGMMIGLIMLTAAELVMALKRSVEFARGVRDFTPGATSSIT